MHSNEGGNEGVRLSLTEVFSSRKRILERLTYFDQSASKELKWLSWFFLHSVNENPEQVQDFCDWWEGKVENLDPSLANQLFYLQGITSEGSTTHLLRNLINYLRTEGISTDLVVVHYSCEETLFGPFSIGVYAHQLCKEWFLELFVTRPWLFNYMAMYLEARVFPLVNRLRACLLRNGTDTTLEVAQYLGLLSLRRIFDANRSYFERGRQHGFKGGNIRRRRVFAQDLRIGQSIGGETATDSYKVVSVTVRSNEVVIVVLYPIDRFFQTFYHRKLIYPLFSVIGTWSY